jgi:hypothetical protein
MGDLIGVLLEACKGGKGIGEVGGGEANANGDDDAVGDDGISFWIFVTKLTERMEEGGEILSCQREYSTLLDPISFAAAAVVIG